MESWSDEFSDQPLKTHRIPTPLAVLFLPVIELEFIHVAGDFDAIAVRIEKADRTVARHHKGLRPADDGNLTPLQDGIELVDDII